MTTMPESYLEEKAARLQDAWRRVQYRNQGHMGLDLDDPSTVADLYAMADHADAILFEVKNWVENTRT